MPRLSELRNLATQRSFGPEQQLAITQMKPIALRAFSQAAHHSSEL